METGERRLGPAAVVYVGKSEVPSSLQPLSWTALKPGWDCGGDDVSDDVSDDNELLVVEGEAAMLTNPVKRLRRGSAQRPLPPETDVDGSKVKRPLYARGGRRGVGGGRFCRSGRSNRRSEGENKNVLSTRASE